MTLHLDIEISENAVEDDVKTVLKSVKPSWDPEKVKFKYFDEGITNKLLGCYVADSFAEAEDVVVVRIFGKKTDLIIDRDAEKNNMIMLNKANLCPPLYAEFKNGIAYGFAHGVTLDGDTVCEENIRKLIAKEMVKLHSIAPSDGSKPECALFKKLEGWLKSIPDKYDDPNKQALFQAKIVPMPSIIKEMEELRSLLENMDYPVVFSHNDLLLKNIIYNQKDESVTFIDQEYGMYNYQPFDIGNHFCEYAGIGDVTDYSRYPDEQYQLEWITTYLEEWRKVHGGPEVTESDVWKMYCMVNKCALAAHFFWGIWALIQARFSEIDFDYMLYATMRFEEYFAKKDKFLALK